MKISFLGAAGTVTGSKYLLTLESKKILVDCGLYQGYKELRLRNWSKLPVNPSEIDAVILTHAHIDHTGYLPLLVKNGFKGPIYSTPGTKELCAILLPDSGHLQEEDAYAPDSRNTILFTGYQSGGTRGDKIERGEREVKIHGKMIKINAQVEVLHNMSAHADSNEILEWLSHFKKPPKKVFITHGEPHGSAGLKEKIENRFGWDCIVPAYQQVEIL